MSTELNSKFQIPDCEFWRWQNQCRPHTRVNLSSAACSGPLMAELLPTANIEELDLSGYAMIEGDDSLRQAIAKLYPGLNATHIVVFCGAQEAITCAHLALSSKIDFATVMLPAFIPLFLMCRAQSVEIRPVPLIDTQNAWQLDFDRFKEQSQAIGKNNSGRAGSGLMVVNFPHNPTGADVTTAEFQILIDHARSQTLFILSDEVFAGLEFNENFVKPPAASLYERAISIGSASKSLGLPGLRIGWLACRDQSILSDVKRIKRHFSICPSRLDERLLEVALSKRETILNKIKNIIQENIRCTETALAKTDSGISWHRPQSGPLAFARLSNDKSARLWASRLLKSGIQIIPGDCFALGEPESFSNYFRLGMGTSAFAQRINEMCSQSFSPPGQPFT